MKKIRKLLASFLCLVMCLGLLPTWALAENDAMAEEPIAKLLQEEIPEAPVTELPEQEELEKQTEETPAYEEPVFEEAMMEEVPPEPVEEVWQEGTPDVEQNVATEEPEALPEADVVETEAGIAVADTEVGEPATETDIQESAEPIEEKDAIPVVVAFVVTPEEAELLVYIKDENDEKTEIDPEEDGSYLLLPGEYFYTLTADGYVSAEEESITVEPSEEAVEVELTLAPVEAIAKTESTEEATLQATTETEESAMLMASSGSCGTNLTWKLDDEGTVTISGSGAMDNYNADSPWYNSTAVKKVVISYGVTSIGNNAFYGCSNLNNLSISSSVKSIGDFAFYKCSSIYFVSIPGTVTSIGNSAFERCSNLGSVLTINSGTKTIGNYAFSRCTMLSTVNIPSTITNIGTEAFYGCTGLKKVKLQANPEMGEGVFAQCSQLKSAGAIGSDCNIEWAWGDFIPDNALSRCNSLTSVSIPDGVWSIGARAFSQCSSLYTVSIPESVGYIYTAAFSGCSFLRYVVYDGNALEENILIEENNEPLMNATIRYPYEASGSCGTSLRWGMRKNGTLVIEGSGDMYQYSADNPAPWQDYITNISSVEVKEGAISLGSQAFYGCTSLRSITLPQSLTAINEGAFAGSGLTSITLPDSVRTLGKAVFLNCESLQSVTMSKNLQEIPYGTFGVCSLLSSVTIPEGISKIGEQAFQRCTSLHSITLPQSLESIEKGAFAGSGLTSITLPDSVRILGEGAFLSCESLQTVTLSENLTEILNQTFAGCSLLSNIAVPNGITCIGEQAFSLCSSLKNVTLPESLTTIEKGAFFQTGLTSVSLPDSVITLGDETFVNCSSLQTVTLSRNLETIPSKAFLSCSSLSDISIPEGIINVGESVFQACSSLENIILPESLTSIGSNAFFQSGITSIIVPDGVQMLGEGVFMECFSLRKAILPEGLETIPDYSFAGCSSLYSISIPKSVTEIGMSAFAKCSSMISYTLPDGLRTIGQNAFAWGSFTSFTIPDSVTMIGLGAFGACSLLSTIRIPASVISIETEAFSACTALEVIRFLGSPPVISGTSFKNVTANVYYPAGYGWYEEKRLNYGGTLTWYSFAMIRLEQDELTMQLNSSEELKAILTGGATMDDVSWTSSDPTVATVSQKGIVTAKTVGTARITATLTDSNVSASCIVTVTSSDIPAVSVQLNKTNTIIVAGQSETLRATVLPENATNKRVSWSSSNTTVATVSGNGTVTAKAVGTAVITAETVNGKKASCTYQVLFTDVANLSDYFYTPVYWAVENGITSGTSATTFSPYNACTRAQVMSFLWKANGSPIVGGSNPFTDVKESDYFYNAVLWAVSQGITSGTSATTFSPYNPCTRAQVMSFLYKAMGSPEVSSSNPFTDVKESDYFYAPVLWAVSQGITNGTSATTFGPYNTCTRAQVMTFLYKAMN